MPKKTEFHHHFIALSSFLQPLTKGLPFLLLYVSLFLCTRHSPLFSSGGRQYRSSKTPYLQLHKFRFLYKTLGTLLL